MITLIIDVTIIRMIIAFLNRNKPYDPYDEVLQYLLHLWISGIIYNIILLTL
jgi:hypothetical protein